jgi:hypothetical protein
MKFPLALLVILLIITSSCKNKAGEPGNTTTTLQDSARVNDSATSYLPIADLIRQDLQRVDSFAGGILKKSTINGKKDSVFIRPPALHEAARAFLLPELETTSFRRSFTENSFMDQSTEQIQFIYTPKDPAVSIRNVVAYITPSGSGDKVSRIYLEREWTAGDTLIQQKLTWKTNQYFYIITIRQPKQGAPSTSIEKLIWDPEHFAD